jgi:hypothetical protein
MVAGIRDAVTVDGAKGESALRNPEILALHDAWEREYSETSDTTWQELQPLLHSVLAGLKVVEVNSSKTSAGLAYESTDDYGVTVIAVGGYSLSRGLTLQGLTVSYFLRNSVMYDTLMQMGRWFGYRPGYEDVCRVWILEVGANWYADVHLAMEELHVELGKMERAGATPEDFGLAVRSHQDALMVTARNKMGSGREVPVSVALAGRLIETTRIPTNTEVLHRNLDAGSVLSAGIEELGLPYESLSRGPLFRDVPVSLVLQFLRSFRADTADLRKDPRLLLDYLEMRQETELAHWDVFFASSTRLDQHEGQVGIHRMRKFERSVAEEGLRRGVLEISGQRRRLGSTCDEAIGLEPDDRRRATELFRMEEPDKKSATPGKYLRAVRPHPLMILRMVMPKIDGDLEGMLPDTDILGWSIHLPRSEIEGGKVAYVVNSIRLRELHADDEFEEEAHGDTD